MIVVNVYRKGCIKRSPLVERKGDLLRQVIL